jgi:HlyD family secretion protein
MARAAKNRIDIDRFRVPAGGKRFRLKDVDPGGKNGLPDRAQAEVEMAADVAHIDVLQEIMYAQGKHALLCIFQAVDCGGKDGTIRSVFVDYNTPVKVGQALAELDTDKLKATLNSSRAKLASAKAKVLDAEATLVEKRLAYERKRTLATSKTTSQQDLDTASAAHDRAIAALESAKAEVGVAQADVELNETNLLKSRIVSPINGVVLKRNVDRGQTVASSFQAPILFTIAEDLKQMEVQVDVDEADVGKVKEGQQGTFSVDAHPDRKFQARIRELRYGSEVVQGVVTYKAVLSTDNSDLLLRPGMTATAEIVVQQVSKALTVPNAALRYAPPAKQASERTSLLRRLLPGRPPFRPASQRDESGPSRRVWIVKNGAAVPVRVLVGVSDGQRTEIVKGEIAEKQSVIVDSTTAKR